MDQTLRVLQEEERIFGQAQFRDHRADFLLQFGVQRRACSAQPKSCFIAQWRRARHVAASGGKWPLDTLRRRGNEIKISWYST